MASSVATLVAQLRAEGSQFTAGMATAQGELQALQTQTTTTSNVMSNALIAVGAVAVYTMAKSADAVITLATEVRQLEMITGASAEDMSRLIYAAHAVNVSFSQLQMGVVFLEKNLSKNTAAVMKYGLSLYNLDGTQKDFNQVLNETVAAYQKLPAGVERTAFALAIFGRSGRAMIPVLNQGVEGLNKLEQAASDAGVVLSQSQVDAAREVTEAMARLSSAWQGFMVTMGTAELGPIKAATDALTWLTEALTRIPGVGRDVVLLMAALAGGVALVARVASPMVQTAQGIAQALGWWHARTLASTASTAANTAATEAEAEAMGQLAISTEAASLALSDKALADRAAAASGLISPASAAGPAAATISSGGAWVAGEGAAAKTTAMSVNLLADAETTAAAGAVTLGAGIAVATAAFGVGVVIGTTLANVLGLYGDSASKAAAASMKFGDDTAAALLQIEAAAMPSAAAMQAYFDKVSEMAGGSTAAALQSQVLFGTLEQGQAAFMAGSIGADDWTAALVASGMAESKAADFVQFHAQVLAEQTAAQNAASQAATTLVSKTAAGTLAGKELAAAVEAYNQQYADTPNFTALTVQGIQSAAAAEASATVVTQTHTEAIQALQSALLGEADAALGVAQAHMNVRQATSQLNADIKQYGRNSLQVKQDQLALRSAQLGVLHANESMRQSVTKLSGEIKNSSVTQQHAIKTLKDWHSQGAISDKTYQSMMKSAKGLQTANEQQSSAAEVAGKKQEAQTAAAAASFDPVNKLRGVVDDLAAAYTGLPPTANTAVSAPGASTAKQQVDALASAIANLKAAGGMAITITSHALGGTVHHALGGSSRMGGEVAWVGEQGPELAVLPGGTQIIPNDRISVGAIASDQGGPITVNVTVNAAPGQSAQEIADATVKVIRREIESERRFRSRAPGGPR